METSAVVSMILIGIVAVFAALGAWRGLIMTVARLVVIVVALMAAMWLAETYSPRLADAMAPMVHDTIVDHLSDVVSSQTANLPGLSGGQDALENAMESSRFSPQSMQMISNILNLLGEKNNIMKNFTEQITDSLREMQGSFVGSAADALTAALSGIIARIAYTVIYAASFFLISTVLRLILKIVDPMLKNMPVIGQINTIGGALFGFAEGVILSGALLWVLQHLGIPTPAGLGEALSELVSTMSGSLPV